MDEEFKHVRFDSESKKHDFSNAEKWNWISQFRSYFTKQTNGLFYMEILQVLFSLLFTALYIVDCYFTDYGIDNTWLPIGDLIISAVLVALFLLRAFMAPNRLHFLCSGYALLDYITLLPVIVVDILNLMAPLFYTSNVLSTLKVLSVFRIIKLLRVLLLSRYAERGNAVDNAVAKLLILLMTIGSFLVLFAGTYQVFENLFRDTNNRISFHNALYFTFNALTMLSLGEPPETGAGRIVLVIFWCIGIIIIPLQLSELIALVVQREITLNKVVRSFLGYGDIRNHFVIAGRSTAKEMRELLRELYVKRSRPKRRIIVVLNNDSSYNELYHMLQCDDYIAEDIKLVTGDISDPKLAHKINLYAAKAVCLMASEQLGNHKQQDEMNLLTTANIRNFSSKINIMVQMVLPESKPFVMNAGANTCICLQDLKFDIMSMNAVSPGFSTLIHNLVYTKPKNWSLHKHRRNTKIPWQDEYIEGLHAGIFVENFSNHFHDIPFHEAVGSIFDVFGVTCIGLKRRNNGMILLNPGHNFRINTLTDAGIIIAHGAHYAEGISHYQPRKFDYLSTRSQSYVLNDDPIASQHPMHFEELNIEDAYFNKDTMQENTKIGNMSRHVRNDLGALPLERLFNRLGFCDDPHHILDTDILKEEFDFLQRKQSLDSMILPRETRRFTFTGHIIMLGDLSTAIPVLLRLRHMSTPKHLSESVVVLIYEDERELETLHVDGLGFIHNVYAFQTRGSSQTDLHSLRAEDASRVLYLNPSSEISTTDVRLKEFFPIKVTMAVQSLNYTCQFVCDISTMETLQFFRTSKLADGENHTPSTSQRTSKLIPFPHLWRALRRWGSNNHHNNDMEFYQNHPFFASGRVFSTSFFAHLCGNAIDREYIFRVVEDLMQIPFSHRHNVTHGRGIFCTQINVPQKLQDNGPLVPYRSVFHHVLSTHGAISIGILRAKGTHRGNEFEYVVTDPAGDTSVEPGDKIFVIADKSILNNHAID